MKKSLAAGLSIYLLLFVVDAAISVVDDALILWFDVHALTVVRGLLSFAVLGLSLVVYLLMGAIPAIPKRLFGPVVLFNFVAGLMVVPLAIYHFQKIPQIAFGISVTQLAVGLAVLYGLQGRLTFGWQSVPEDKLRDRLFSGWRLAGFLLVNLFILLPGMVVYLAFCTSLAIDHFSGGFLVMNSNGFAVRTQTYSRPDGKSVRLVPMMHIAETGFYQRISESFDTNAVILLEGVSDRKNLLRHHLSYRRMAGSLGLSEQQEDFSPAEGRSRRADLDVEEFSAGTIDFLNMVSQIHAQGLTAETIPLFMRKSQSPELVERLWEDLLTLRNRHLVREIERELAESKAVVVPWGAAHMPGVAREIQGLGFTSAQSQEFPVVEFGTLWKALRGPKRAPR